MTAKEELIKLIQENPTLDIVCMCSDDELIYGYYSYLDKLSVDVRSIYEYDGHIYDDIQDVEELLQDACLDNEDWANLSDEEYEKLVKELAKKYFKKKAIVIWASVI